MRDDQGTAYFVAYVILGTISSVAWYFVGRDDGRKHIYDEAIKAGAAVRVVDQETGEVSVEWRTCE